MLINDFENNLSETVKRGIEDDTVQLMEQKELDGLYKLKKNLEGIDFDETYNKNIRE